jgi:putative FmdB family regulatory protein
MPIYEYSCPACGESFEAYKRLSEEKERETCPKCGGAARKARISLFQTGSPSPSAKGSCGSGGGKLPFR